MTKSVAYKGKTIVYTSDDERAIRQKLCSNVSFDALNEKERIILTEIARAESLRWKKSNATRTEQSKILKQHAHVLKRIDELDDTKRAKLEEILG